MNARTNPSVLFESRRKVSVTQGVIPSPGPGDALVEASRSLISTGTELTCLCGDFEPGGHWEQWVRYPFSPGYSLAGTLTELGTDTPSDLRGARVAVSAPHRRFVLSKAWRLIRVPDEISDEEAAWFHIAAIVMNGVRRGQQELGDTVVVVGLGVLGLLVVQFAKLMGAQSVIVIGQSEKRLKAAVESGATQVVVDRAETASEAVRELTQGKMADVVYDVSGNPAVLGAAARLVRKFGKIVLLSDVAWPSKQCLSGNLLWNGLQLIGAHDDNLPAVPSADNWWTHKNLAQLFFSLIADKRIRVSHLISHHFEVERAPEAYDFLLQDRNRSLGVMLTYP